MPIACIQLANFCNGFCHLFFIEIIRDGLDVVVRDADQFFECFGLLRGKIQGEVAGVIVIVPEDTAFDLFDLELPFVEVRERLPDFITVSNKEWYSLFRDEIRNSCSFVVRGYLLLSSVFRLFSCV